MGNAPFLDFPTAWAIQKECGAQLEHHPRCSSVPGWHALSGPAFLCDCGAVKAEWVRRQAHPTPAQEGTKQRTVAGYRCPSSECPFCSGEMCWTHDGGCECDVLARHEGAPAQERS